MKTYTEHQFLNTREPYEYLYKMKNDTLRHEQALTAIMLEASNPTEGISEIPFVSVVI